ncbi:MAG: hypothetical protein PHP52_00700 [Bacteroidales bacterium]|nr:hypothetical protein [Bacteroidales bacterium]
MKRNILKKLLVIVAGITVICGTLVLLYFSRANISNDIYIQLNSESQTRIYAISPTGGVIDFLKKENNTFVLNARYVWSIVIETNNPDQFIAKLKIGESEQIIEAKSLKIIELGKYRIDSKAFPKVPLFKKISLLTKNNLTVYFGFFAIKLLEILLYYYIGIFSFLAICKLWGVLKKSYKEGFSAFKTFIASSFRFIKTENFKIPLIYILSVLPPLLFYFSDNQILNFLGFSLFNFLIVFATLIFPFLLLGIYSKKLKLNSFFWWSLLISFVWLVFVLKSSIYLYGTGFRDDISKFFVKADFNNFFDCLVTPDAGYLNAFQNLTAYILLKALGFRQFFPEALQITTAICFSLVFASFNLKIFRLIIKDDKLRFLISLMFLLNPIVFLSSNFLFEVPFAVSTILFLFIFTNLNPTPVKKKTLIAFGIVFILFALSKPIFTLLLPFVIIVIIYQLVRMKNKSIVIVFITICVAIITQIIVAYIQTDQIINLNENGLGTFYESAFKIEHKNFIDLIIVTVFVFIRSFVGLIGLPPIGADWINLLVNVLAVALGLIIMTYYIIKIIKKRGDLIPWFILASLILSFASVFLYIYVTDMEGLVFKNPDFASLSFIEMFQANSILNQHRYLSLSSFLNFIVITVFGFEITDLFAKTERVKGGVKISFLILITAIHFNKNIVYLNAVDKATEKVSYWRAYNCLIFDNNDYYYIPYNGFPEQKHCVKSGIDKIFDVNIINQNSVWFSEIYKNAENWDVIEVILETNPSGQSPKLIGVNKNNEEISTEIINGNNQKLNSILYKFDAFEKLSAIKFVYADSSCTYSGLVRIVGRYE